MSESLPKLLLRRSEAGPGAALWGHDAQPHFGRSFDRLLADRVLTEQPPATTWPPCSSCDGGCGVREIVEIDGHLVAECPEDHRCDTFLAPHEVRSFAIDPEALACRISKATGIQGTPFLITAGAWMLGRSPTSGCAVALILDPIVARSRDLVTMLRADAPSDCAITVLLPFGMPRADTRHLSVAAFHIVVAVDALVGAAGEGFALDTSMLDPVIARDPQVILQSASRSMVIFGRTVQLSRRRFEVAEVLAKATSQGAIASRRDIERRLYGNRSVDDKLVADAVRDLRDGVAHILPSGMSPIEFIQTRTGQGYALGVDRDRIRIDP